MTSSRTRPAVAAAEASLLHEGAALVTTSPFEEPWLAIQKRLLGNAYQDVGPVLALVGPPEPPPLPNLARIMERLRQVHMNVRTRLCAGAPATPENLDAYAKVGFLLLYLGFEGELQEVADSGVTPGDLRARFQANHDVMFALPGVTLDVPPARELLEACFQARRTFYIVHTTLRGVSPEAGKLRAQVWNARFPGGDLMRYARGGRARQTGAHWLLLGETGTGKEVVARAFAYSRPLPFLEEENRFAGRAADGFHAVNTSGLPVTLVDSLLFGHKKGAFTGAVKDAAGWLAKCVPLEVLFLDEFGDLAPEVQTKLLRVVEEGKYTPLGATKELTVGGTLVFAAQPDLFRSRQFRRDMRHRLNERVIRLPSLRARIDSDPAELPFLVRLFATPLAGRGDPERLIADVLRMIETRLRKYPWTGNIRELRNCVIGVHEQRDYVPPSGYQPPPSITPRSSAAAPSKPPAPPAPQTPPAQPGADLAEAVLEGKLSLAELRRRYILHAYAKAGSYTAAAKLLEINWRTVRAVVREEMARTRAALAPQSDEAPAAGPSGEPDGP